MRLANALIFGAWLIVFINLLLAFAAVGVFMRMTPAIADIISNNERSLQACEDMLVSLALYSDPHDASAMHEKFKHALARAQANVTEPEEPAILKNIEEKVASLFSGNKNALVETIEAVARLSEINRKAMSEADTKAQQLGKGGAWGVVFMAIFSLIAGIIFIVNLKSKLLKPVEELRDVLMSHQKGETMRRCSGVNLSTDIKNIFGAVNRLLDRTINQNFRNYS